MPYGSSVNDLPTGFFLAAHIAALALGAGFARLGFEGERAHYTCTLQGQDLHGTVIVT